MTKIILTVEDAQIALKNYYTNNYAFANPFTVMIDIASAPSYIPSFPEFKEFVTKWQHIACPSRKIEMIKDLREFYVKKGYSIMGLAEAKWFIEKMFLNTNYPS